VDADRHDGIFGPLRIGPIASLGVPRPVSVELFAKVANTIGVGIEYSFLPTMTVDIVTVRAQGVAGDLRWFVLGSPFFLGVGAGVQWLSAVGSTQGYTATVDASKTFITPRLGVMWTFGPGFSIGADAGVELPVAYTTTVAPPIEQITDHALVKALTRSPLPDVHLARLGWLF
jgi:hypothetical protein